MRAYIVCGNVSLNLERILAGRGAGDLVIAADAGANPLLAAGFVPDVVIGDMDSIRKEVLGRLHGESLVLRHPADKDYTDAELALRLAAERGATELVLLNDLGGRFDQALGVVSLLFLARELGIPAYVEAGRQRVYLVCEHWEAQVAPGSVTSLLPVSADVLVRDTQGLRWPLRGEKLFRAGTRGISNEAREERVAVDVAAGDLLVIVSTGDSHEV